MSIITSLTDLSRLREGIDAVSTQLKHSGPVMMMLGPFMFATDTAAFESFTHAAEYRWASQARVGRRPSLQHTGIGPETIDLKGTIYPEYAGGISQVQAMRELAGLGKPMILVDGRGIVYDEWAILRVEEVRTILNSDSTPRKIIFNMNLSRYGKDQPEGLASLVR